MKAIRLAAMLAIASALASGALATGPSDYSGGLPSSNATGRITIAACGDIMMDRAVSAAMRKYGEDWPFSGTSGLISSADIAFANLETSVTDAGSRIPGKGIWFRMAPERLSLIKSAGIDILSIANNHIMDYGQMALLDTMRHLDEAGIIHIGAGRDLSEARRGRIAIVNGIKVGFLAYSDFHDIFWSFSDRLTFGAGDGKPGIAPAEAAMMAEDIKRIRSACDFVVASVHWGQEYMRFPDKSQVERAHAIIDAGADVVLGHHPHVLQPIETYNGGLIFYSLGNFIFDQTGERETESMIAFITLIKGRATEAEAVPVRISESRPAPMAGAEAMSTLSSLKDDSMDFGSQIYIQGGRLYLSADGRKPLALLRKVIEGNPLIFPKVSR